VYAFHQELIDRLHRRTPDSPGYSLSSDDAVRLDRFARISPLYRNYLLQHPEDLPWLITLPLPNDETRDQMTFEEWRHFQAEQLPRTKNYLATLRMFRRRMSMRIAYRDVNRLQSSARNVHKLSLLAELCLRECFLLSRSQWQTRYGEPWDELLDRPARFCVLALGKLGGRELNFSSDIDLIYFYEGEGCCRRDGQPTTFTNPQLFTKVAETMTHLLQEQTEHGFLFRVDLRLRPEGTRSPLVRSFSGMENYYAATGQSWERMALIKARPVAGDFSLGGELLESLHSFRYPRHAPPSLLAEIAAMKTRTEKEVVGAANLRRDVKSGYGGIREIEFIVQTMQLLHAGRFPFLQTGSTIEGLDQLVRYELMKRPDAVFLQEAYWFLRTLEHRLQIREERQTHSLPTDPEQLDLIAESFGFPDGRSLQKKTNDLRDEVRSHYDALLRAAPVNEELGEWWLFFSERKTTPRVAESLHRWFGNHRDAFGPIQDFVQGSRHFLLTRKQVSRFTGLRPQLDRIMPELANPLATLKRISRFAESYGSRSLFLATCSLDPRFLRVLALLFDRSEFIHQLLCQHPEILDEVLRPEILRRRKSVADTLRELAEGAPPEDGFEAWLWLYVKAEQIRIAIGDLLGYLPQEETEQNLTTLADAVLTFLAQRIDPGQRLLIVALGKYGGRELTFGSDLDLLILGERHDPPGNDTMVRKLAQCLASRPGLGSIYQSDFRLRPHGQAGPLVPTLAALRRYYHRSAQGWEKQALARARPVTGQPQLRAEFLQFLDELLYRRETSPEELQELWNMRLRIERERNRTDPPQRAFKTGPGGMIELEFFGQFLQLRHGHRHSELRQPNTRRLLRDIGRLGLMAPGPNATLIQNFDFLKRVEVLLRRNRNAAVSVIGDSPEEQSALARWSGFPDRPSFWAAHHQCMTSTREVVAEHLAREFNIDLSGTEEKHSPFRSPFLG
jgi:glutamate-ammonia-ligase adenylyltransferase